MEKRMHHEDPKERLQRLLGTRLANQLIIDVLKSNADLQKELLTSILKAYDDRMSLAGDELVERRFDGVRDEALACIKHLMLSASLCSAVNASCIIARGQDHSVAAFVAHVATHYEDELATPREAPDLIDEMRERKERSDEKALEHRAKAHSSNNLSLIHI
jgi:hypothetical protein